MCRKAHIRPITKLHALRAAGGRARPSRRRSTAILIAITLFGTSTIAASAQQGLPTPAENDGTRILALLDEVNLAGEWRDATGLTEWALRMKVLSLSDDAPRLMVDDARRLDDAGRRQTAAVTAFNASRARRDSATKTEAKLAGTRDSTHETLTDAIALVGEVSIRLFTGAGGRDDSLGQIDFDAMIVGQRSTTITAHALEELIAQRDTAQKRADDAFASWVRGRNRRAAADADLASRSAELRAAIKRRSELYASTTDLIPRAAAVWATTPIEGQSTMTPRVLDAYLRAEVAETIFNPGCRISWRTLAAIGAVESGHGSAGGGIDLDGMPNYPVIGLRLDGSADPFGGTLDSIADTDHGRWDGDPTHDRAVGPMQFIPETWERWGVDGDLDGKKSPNDIDDSAMSTAAYLCSYGSQRSWTTWNAAVFGYNHSPEYVIAVHGALQRTGWLRLTELDEGPTLQPGRPYGTWIAPEVEESAE